MHKEQDSIINFPLSVHNPWLGQLSPSYVKIIVENLQITIFMVLSNLRTLEHLRLCQELELEFLRTCRLSKLGRVLRAIANKSPIVMPTVAIVQLLTITWLSIPMKRPGRNIAAHSTLGGAFDIFDAPQSYNTSTVLYPFVF